MTSSERVILLNADYSFLNTIDWKKAMCLISKGKTEIVKYSKKVIRTAQGILKIPSVMRLIKFIRTIYRTKVPYSKKNVLIRDGFKCVYCGAENIRLTIDHIVPKSKGGKSSFENCVASCRECNLKKGDKKCSEVKIFPKTKITEPTIAEFLILRMKKQKIDKIIEDCFKQM